MYERMLNKQVAPSIEDLTAYCGENAELFALMNEWLSQTYGTVQTIVFPYGNKYGWGVAHRKKEKAHMQCIRREQCLYSDGEIIRQAV